MSFTHTAILEESELVKRKREAISAKHFLDKQKCDQQQCFNTNDVSISCTPIIKRFNCSLASKLRKPSKSEVTDM